MSKVSTCITWDPECSGNGFSGLFLRMDTRTLGWELFLCVEPLKNFEEDIKETCRPYRCQVTGGPRQAKHYLTSTATSLNSSSFEQVP